jgi:hypothetical protein
MAFRMRLSGWFPAAAFNLDEDLVAVEDLPHEAFLPFELKNASQVGLEVGAEGPAAGLHEAAWQANSVFEGLAGAAWC